MYKIREALTPDIHHIIEQRRQMFLDIGFENTDTLSDVAEAFGPWVEQKMSAGDYLGWFATTERGDVVAGLGLWLIEWPPHLIGTSAHRAYILNVYTHPDHRRQGLAKRLTETAIDWCKEHGIDYIFLHASQHGRPIYEALDFKQGSEMRLVL
jgi:GNAT superfamily N-acetyltransferase